jgi:CRISPR-associated protein (TIGR03986 family)
MVKKGKKEKEKETGLEALGQLLSPEARAAYEASRKAEQARNINQVTREKKQPSNRPPEFHNPYNFIPALPREHVGGELGDRIPTSHSIYENKSWSGRLSLKLTTQTPLLIPDAAQAKRNEHTGHSSFPLRKVGSQPYLAPTSIKGMLRTAYEAVTNSRMGVFQDHGERLAYRMDARDGLSLVPVRIGNDGKNIELLLGTTPGIPTQNQDRWQIPDSLMYAAWLPSYEHKSDRPSRDAVTCEGMHHGQKVKAWVQQVTVWKKPVNRKLFSYWRVCPNSMVPANQPLSPTPQLWKPTNTNRHEPTNTTRAVEGYLCITGKNIGKKYNERLFFVAHDNRLKPQLNIQLSSLESEELKKAWKELIQNYQAEHQSDIDKNQAGPPQAENGAKWSRYITATRGLSQAQETELKEGTLCYAKVEESGNTFRVLTLYPVMIARTLFSQSPDKLLSDSLKPATSIQNLSPADRVFGWAKQQGSGAHKGQIRIHSVKCVSSNSIETFTIGTNQDLGLALNILGQPKPTQTRFYVAQDSQGMPLEGVKNQDSYERNQGLRGRKVYPHHTVPSDYWSSDIYSREYARPHQEQDSQNRSIQAWVKPDTEFQFQMDMTNLSDLEIGALLWLLMLPPKHYHRMGGGKPFGFGSVSLEVDWEKSDFRLGEAWQKFYSTISAEELSNSIRLAERAEDLKQDFERVLQDSYGSHQLFLTSFLRMAQGFTDDLPIHYPRNHAKATLEDENFKWFEENEKSDQLALPLLIEDNGLPRFGEPEKNRNDNYSRPKKSQGKGSETENSQAKKKPAPPILRSNSK